MLKIFEILHKDGEKEWCTGATNIEAFIFYVRITGCDLDDMCGSEISEIPQEKWDKYIVKDEEESKEKSFNNWMDNYGKDSPQIIAGTMYNG